jgi:hypothetical protein
MRKPQQGSAAVLLGCLGTIAILASCSSDAPTAPDQNLAPADLVQTAGTSVPVCHRSGTGGAIIDVPPAALAAHLAHGDYLTSLAVSHVSRQRDDATHFHRIGDALAAARAGRLTRGELRSAACRITITVAAGVFRGTNLASTDGSLEHFPLVVDVPAITLRGGLVMQLDASGRATGSSVTHLATTLAPIEPLSDLGGFPWVILANGDPGGSAGNGLTVEGFAFRSGHEAGTGADGSAVVGMQVRGLALRGNRFEEGFFVTLDLQATTAVIERNHVSGTGLCDMCLAGPGVYRVTGNRILSGALEGILTTPAFFPATQAAADVTVDITNNEVRDHRGLPAGAAIRIGTVGMGAADVHGSSHITIRDNLLVNNNFAMMFEASFPEPDTKLRGDLDVTLSSNVLRRSCQADLYVAFARHVVGLGLFDGPYLRNSTYRLALGGDLRWSEAWFSNPAGFGNTLLVNGRPIAHRTRQFFDAASCPARTGAQSNVVMSATEAR